MRLAINEFVVRHRTTGKIWFRCICLNDQDNNVVIDEVFPDYRSEQADEFNDNFAGHRNVRYLSSTKNFVCGRETTITERTIAELCTKPKSIYLVFMLENINSEHTVSFENRADAEAEAKIRNTNYANYAKCAANKTKYTPVNKWNAHLYFHVREIPLI